MHRTLRSCLGMLLVLGMFILGLSACHHRAADTQENRLKAAREYQQVSPLKVTLDDAVNDLAKQFAPDKRSDFIRFMRMHIEIGAIQQKEVEAMADHFTVREIQALTRFYGSPEGRSINKKYGDYMADIMPVIQSQLAHAAGAWLAQQHRQDQQQPLPPKQEAPPKPPAARKSGSQSPPVPKR